MDVDTLAALCYSCRVFMLTVIMSTDVISFGTSRQKTLRDQLSPYRIAVLVLIEDYCSNTADGQNYSDEEELTFLSTLLQLIQVIC